MGKTSTKSILNIPGKLGWFTMEVPGLALVLYNASRLSPAGILELPVPNQILLGMFTMHYVNRAILAPLVLNPSMAPIHLFVWLAALSVQVLNGISIGAWIGRYGRVTDAAWAGRENQMIWGAGLFTLGLVSNMWHDEELREIRRAEVDKREAEAKKKGTKADLSRVYALPERGLFAYVLYPHYLSEWIEWGGYLLFCGLDCVPLQTFLMLEILSMLPRAYNGWYWYVEKFGRKEVGNRKAVIPFLL
jgi:3-oxo-5-alpha-steroid 4-dehydrogenase 1